MPSSCGCRSAPTSTSCCRGGGATARRAEAGWQVLPPPRGPGQAVPPRGPLGSAAGRGRLGPGPSCRGRRKGWRGDGWPLDTPTPQRGREEGRPGRVLEPLTLMGFLFFLLLPPFPFSLHERGVSKDVPLGKGRFVEVPGPLRLGWGLPVAGAPRSRGARWGCASRWARGQQPPLGR